MRSLPRHARNLCRRLTGLLVLGLLILVSSVKAATIWQIGKPDGSYRELAIPGNYPQYPPTFPNDVDYRVGHSQPAKDWPFIHPGPGDNWAGARNHRFRIRFDLNTVPATACRLMIHVVDVQRGSDGPNLEVGINDGRPLRFATPGGYSDDSLTDPRAGRHFSLEISFPASLLRQGENTIDLTKIAGSWLLYDAVTLETGPEIPANPRISGISIVIDPRTMVADVRFRNSGCEGDVEWSVGGSQPSRIHSEPGPNRITFPIAAESLGQRITFKSGSEEASALLIQRRNVWKIGNPDRNYSDFAIAGHYPDYHTDFPHDVNYHVGTSKPERDWPFIHPGPDDWSWARGRSHPFRISFALPTRPIGIHELVISLVDTQPRGNSPVLEVDINGRQRMKYPLPSGGSDNSLKDPRAGRPYRLAIPFPASYLDAGSNYITLNVVQGSWLIYDSVSLDTGSGVADVPQVSGISAATTMFFRRDAGIAKQVVRMSLTNSSVAGPVIVRVSGESGGSQNALNINLAPGVNNFEMLVPPLAQPSPLHVTVSAGGADENLWFEGLPERQWKVYIGASAHTDIGYTDFQERVFEVHNANTAAAIKAADQIPNFKWNLEVGFHGPLFQSRGDDSYKELVDKLKKGRLGLGGLYLNMLTGLCSGEELAQALIKPQEFGRACGVTVEAANLTDVPTAVGTLPMLMSQAGVKYFAGGANENQGPPFRGDRRVSQRPFWWEALDGSRVLALICRGYAQTSKLDLIKSISRMTSRLPGWLKEQEDQPSDAVYIYGSTDDNSVMSSSFASLAAEWNAQWDYPKIIVGRVDEYFHYVEDHFGSALPIIRGDFGSYWEDGAASSALETALSRWAKARLNAATTIQALVAARRSGQLAADAINRAWEKLLFFDEHTWGWRNSVSEPDSEQTRHQWAIKAGYAQDAAKTASGLAGDASATVAKLAGGSPGGTFLVYNEFSWPRDILASAPGGEEMRVESAGENKAAVPCQHSVDRLVFVAEQVPPLGFRAFRLASGVPAKAIQLLKSGPDPSSWESPDYKLAFDPVTGAIQYLFDRKTGSDWVDISKLKGLNQFIYVVGGEGAKTGKDENPDDYKTRSHTTSRISVAENGPLRAVLRIERTGNDLPSVDSYVVLQRGGALNIINVIHKKANNSKEAGYFAFPFRLPGTEPIRGYIELPYGVLEVDREQPSGGCRDWYATNSFCAVTNGAVTAYVGSPHSPLFTFNDIFRGRLRDSLGTLNGTVFAYPFNNYWITNYKASQAGDLVFSYAVRLSKGGFDPAEATKFGWESLSAMPDPRPIESGNVWDTGLQTAIASQIPAGLSNSLLHIEGGQTVVAGLSWGESGLQIRLYNPGNADANSSISLPGLKIRQASRTDLVGAPIEQLTVNVSGDSVSVPVRKRSIATIVLRTESK